MFRHPVEEFLVQLLAKPTASFTKAVTISHHYDDTAIPSHVDLAPPVGKGCEILLVFTQRHDKLFVLPVVAVTTLPLPTVSVSGVSDAHLRTFCLCSSCWR